MTNNIFFDEDDVANIKCLHHSSATEGKRYAAKLDSSWYAAYWQMGPIKGVAKKWRKQKDQKLATKNLKNGVRPTNDIWK